VTRPQYPCIIYSTGNPYTNLAMEEALLETITEGLIPYKELVRIWVNPTSIILGRFSNPFQEVDIEKAASENIPVTRRLTGGRAVFHDEGNLNISLFRHADSHKPVNVDEIYGEGLSLITGVIRKLGGNALIANGNDVTVDGYKVSGSAALTHRNGILFHGTLLVESDMRLLSEVIKRPGDPTLGGRVDPVKFRPKNLSSLIGQVSIDHVIDTIVDLFCSKVLHPMDLPSSVTRRAYKLSQCRYMNPLWIYHMERLNC